MTPADDLRHVPWLRYALLAAALTAVWLVISLFSSAPSASADESDTGSGLLGGATSLLGGVTTVTGGVGDTLGDVVDTVTEPVNLVLEPVVDVAPEPVAEVAPVAPAVVDTATDAANTTISGTNTAVGTLVNGITATLSDVAGGGTVGAVVAPITGVVDGAAGGLPIVGELLGDNAVSGVLSPVTGLIDDTLGTVVGSAGELPTDGTGILPQLPRSPLLPGDSEAPGGTGDPGVVTTPVTWSGGTSGPVGVADAGSTEYGSRALVSSSAASGLAGAITPADGGAPPGGDLPASPAAPAGGSTFGGGGSGGAGGSSGTSDAAFAALELDALASLVLHSVDDALPSSPVFDTDTTPD
jgi:hypothetical protein